MDLNYLYHVLPFLNSIGAKRRKQFEDYFSSAPQWLLDSMQVIRVEKDVTFIKENDPVDTIYLIGEGTIKAVDYRVFGIVFEFMQFDDVYAFGGMEVITGDEVYRTTMQTVTPCIIVKIPKSVFAKWMSFDIIALQKEARNVSRYLLEQGRTERIYLFLQGADRLAFFLVEKYLKYQKNKVLYVNSTRQELAEASGLCVKTVNRAIKKFQENGWITKIGNKFTIDEKQYNELNKSISELIER